MANNSENYTVFGKETLFNELATFVKDLKVYGTLDTTYFNLSSDERLKENIETLDNSLETIEKINPVKFTWKDTGKNGYGVIAQEIEKILPELVSNSNQYKSVDYISLIALIISAMKEQQQKILELEKIVKDIKKNNLFS